MLEPYIILEKFQKLPEEVQDYFSSEKIFAEIDFIERQYNIDLTTLLMAILVSELKIEDFQTELMAENDGIDANKAEKIFQQVNKSIFSKAGKYIYAADEKIQPLDESNSFKKPKEMYVSRLSYSEIIAEIKKSAGLNFEDKNLEKRFDGLTLTALKEVRTLEEYRDSLVRSSKIGGIDMNSQVAEQVCYFLEDYLKKIKERLLIIIEEKLEIKKNPITQPAKLVVKRPVLKVESSSYTPSLASARKDIEQSQHSKINFDLRPKKNPLEDGGWQNLPQARKIDKQERLEKVEFNKKQISPMIAKVPKVLSQVEGVKRPVPLRENLSAGLSVKQIRIEDIKKPVKTMSLIEEISALDLNSFHRLSTDPFTACETIKSKVDLLAEDSYEKRSQAVMGWKKSPLSEAFRQIGQESFQKGQPIEEIIKNKIKQGEKTLTLEEFNAISDLNQHLRM